MRAEEESYPYSMREAIAIVKHAQRFPSDGVLSALENVFSYDSFDKRVYEKVSRVFQRNGIPMTSEQQRLEIDISDAKDMGPVVHSSTLPQ